MIKTRAQTKSSQGKGLKIARRKTKERKKNAKLKRKKSIG